MSILLVSPLSVGTCPVWAHNMAEFGWDLHAWVCSREYGSVRAWDLHVWVCSHACRSVSHPAQSQAAGLPHHKAPAEGAGAHSATAQQSQEQRPGGRRQLVHCAPSRASLRVPYNPFLRNS